MALLRHVHLLARANRRACWSRRAWTAAFPQPLAAPFRVCTFATTGSAPELAVPKYRAEAMGGQQSRRLLQILLGYLDWAHLRRAIFAVRAVFLAVTLYGAGYAAGMQSYAIDPEGARMAQVKEVLKTRGLDPDGEVLCKPDSEEWVSVQAVFPEVLRGAREELRFLIQEVKAKLSQQEEGKQDSELLDELRSLEKARLQIDNWSEEGFLVVNSNSPNAFVHALVPRMIFVHRGLFNMKRYVQVRPGESGIRSGPIIVRMQGNWEHAALVKHVSPDSVVVRLADGEERQVGLEDARRVQLVEGVVQSDAQLAMLLGHELSHVVHNHAEDTTQILASAAGCQLIMLAILDPIGIFSVCADLGMALVARFGVHLPMSRANELEADRTGLRICARGGFDPREAPTFFDRMLAAEEEATGGNRVASWASTHPRTEDRARALRASVEEALELYNQRQLG